MNVLPSRRNAVAEDKEPSAPSPPPSAHAAAPSKCLSGRCYVVTGAALGVGEAVAQALAAAGAAGVTLVDVNAAKGEAVRASLAAAYGASLRAVFVEADLSSADACARAVAEHAAAFGGKCDGLVNCAATCARAGW